MYLAKVMAQIMRHVIKAAMRTCLRVGPHEKVIPYAQLTVGVLSSIMTVFCLNLFREKVMVKDQQWWSSDFVACGLEYGI